MNKASLNFLVATAFAELSEPTPRRYVSDDAMAGDGPNKAFTIPEYKPSKKDLKRKKQKP